MDRSQLETERRNPATEAIDRLSSLEIVDVINAEDRRVAEAVRGERESIADAIDIVVEAFQHGGRLFYVGAGTSGRLGVLDASECPPTFGSDPSIVQGIIAGGSDALVRSIEGAEDYPDGGRRDIAERGLAAVDVVMGIATSGTTPYVHGALEYAHGIGCRTIFFTCTTGVQPSIAVDVIIRPITGPEVVTGSTRMKAGTATKLVLNTITTGAMIRMGKVYGNLMVDLRAVNEKLRDRSRRIVADETGLQQDEAQALLDRAEGHVKTALVMHARDIDRDAAKRRLADADGFVRRAINRG